MLAINAWRSRLDNAAAVLRTILGVPNYDRYLAHMRAHHAECVPLTREAFERERMHDRYSRPGSRCC